MGWTERQLIGGYEQASAGENNTVAPLSLFSQLGLLRKDIWHTCAGRDAHIHNGCPSFSHSVHHSLSVATSLSLSRPTVKDESALKLLDALNAFLKDQREQARVWCVCVYGGVVFRFASGPWQPLLLDTKPTRLL